LGKPCQLNYYAQIAVDDAHHVITGANADFADQRDSECVEKIVGQTIENLEQNGLSIDQLLADTNYSSGSAFRYIEEKNIDAYIPNHGGYKEQREGFIYNRNLDQYECTTGNRAILPFIKIDTGHPGRTRKIYRSSSKSCKNCPLKNACIGKLNYKKITDSTDKPLYDRMHQKMQTPLGKKMSRIRGRTVEPVLGTLINFLNMKRANARGIAQANKQVIMATLSYNLKKYLKFIAPKSKWCVIALPTDKHIKNPFIRID
jgi:hypothetical protein